MRDSLSDLYKGRSPDDEDAITSPLRTFFGGRGRSSRTIGVVLILIVLLVLHQRSESTGTPGKSTAPKKVAQIGQRVTDSHLAFEVSNVTCDVRKIGIAPYIVTAAKGHQWCIVSMTVSAAAEEEIQYSDAIQDAYLQSGTRITVDVGASYFLYQANNGRLVAPKSPVHVRIPFEVPDGQKITLLVLHDSAFSAGASVRI